MKLINNHPHLTVRFIIIICAILITNIILSETSKAKPPPYQKQLLSIFFDKNDNFKNMKQTADYLCNNSDKHSAATQVLCLYAESAKLKDQINQSKTSSEIEYIFYIDLTSIKQLIETLHAAQQSCYYSTKKDDVTTIMCAYAEAAQPHLDSIKNCLKIPYESNSFEEVNYCVNDGYRLYKK